MSGSLVPEARHRSSSALSAFIPLASKVFGSAAIARGTKVRLGTSIIVSKLLFGVHVWSTFSGSARRALNKVYMKLWRRIAGDPNFGSAKFSDLRVRQLLRIDSLDCAVRCRRLKYLSRIMHARVPELHALLNATNQKGTAQPWIRLIADDLAVLFRYLPRVFGSLPPPWIDAAPYWRLAGTFPNEWFSIVALYHTPFDDVDMVFPSSIASVQAPLNVTSSVSPMQFVCNLCDQRFVTDRALQCHKRSKHKTRSEVVQFIGNTSMCTVCGVDFHSRLRLITHLGESRVRSAARGASCKTLFLASRPVKVDESELHRLNIIDQTARRLARAKGHTHEIASKPARRTKQSILKRPRKDSVPVRRRLSRKTTDVFGIFKAPGV